MKTLVLSLFVHMTKFQSYVSSYHPMQKASNWKGGLDMEKWLTPWMTSTYKRPFTPEGSYLVSTVLHMFTQNLSEHCIWYIFSSVIDMCTSLSLTGITLSMAWTLCHYTCCVFGSISGNCSKYSKQIYDLWILVLVCRSQGVLLFLLCTKLLSWRMTFLLNSCLIWYLMHSFPKIS